MSFEEFKQILSTVDGVAGVIALFVVLQMRREVRFNFGRIKRRLGIVEKNLGSGQTPPAGVPIVIPHRAASEGGDASG